MKTLIVDDHALNRKLLRALLEAEGHDVVEAGDGLEALQILEGESVDAIISDVLMPNMDGFRLCLEIRKQVRFSALPFIVYTSTYSSASDRSLALKVGADSYLVKPAPAHAILAALAEAVKEAAQKPPSRAPGADEADVIKQYNVALVTKLEERNTELSESLLAREEAEKEIRIVHAQLRQLLEHSPAVLYALRLDKQTAVPYLVSENITQLLGFSVAETLHSGWWLGQLHPDDRERALASISDTLAQAVSHIEYRMQHKDGSYRWLDDNRRSICNAQGEPVELVGVWADITARKKAEERLRLQHAVTGVLAEAAPSIELNRRILETLCEGLHWDLGELWMVDRTLRILRCTDVWHPPLAGFREFAEASRNLLFPPGKGLPGCVWASGQAEWSSDVTQDPRCERRGLAARLGLHGWIGFPIVLRDHTLGVVALFNRQEQILDEEILTTLAAIGTQIGQFFERQQLTEQFRQAQKMEAIGTLAGGIAHDFNNILAAIVGYTELTKMELAGHPELGQHLDDVLRGTSRAVMLVRQILAFSRQQAQERKAVQLRNVVSEALTLLRATIPTQIEFVVEMAPDLSTVLADTTQVHQIVMNLGTNAVHAMKDCPGRLAITLQNVEVDPDFAEAHPPMRSRRHVRLSISDTGHGMDQATVSRIFEPFFTTKAPGEGTGLGLAVVLGIMQTHDGVVTVYSQPGEGTTFHLYFPALDLDEAELVEKKAALWQGNGQHILYVDDEQTLARMGKNMLERLGYVVDAQTDALAALELVRTKPNLHDLVITDQMMPMLTGVDLAKQLFVIRPNLPVILISGYTAALTLERIKAAGIRKLLLKPISIDTLSTVVHEVLAESASR